MRSTGIIKGGAARLKTIEKISGKIIKVGDKSYLVRSLSDIFIDGSSATFNDLQVGMKVRVTGSVSHRGDSKATTLYEARRVAAHSLKGGGSGGGSRSE